MASTDDLVANANNKQSESLAQLLLLIQASEKTKTVKYSIWFTLTALYVIYVVSTTAVLFLKGWNSTHFMWKSRIFTLIATFANLAFVVHAMVTEALTPKYPCSVRLWITYYTVFYWSLAVHVRGLKYIYTVRVNALKSDLADVLNELEKHSDFDDISAKGNSVNKLERSSSLTSFGRERLDTTTTTTKINMHYSQSPFVSFSRTQCYKNKLLNIFRLKQLGRNSDNISSLSLEEQYTILRKRLTSTLAKGRWLSDRFFLAVFAVIAAIIAVACVLGQRDPRFQHKPPYYGCPAGISPPLYFLYIWLFLNIIVIFPALIYYCRGIHDAYGMRSELQVSLIAGSISIPAMLIYNQIVPARILVKLTGYWLTCIFLGVAHWMLIVRPMISILRENRMKGRYRNNLPRSSTSSRPSNLSRREQFEFLLSSPEGFEKLADAARRTFCPENVDFLRDYQYLKWRVCYTVVSDGAVNGGEEGNYGDSTPNTGNMTDTSSTDTIDSTTKNTDIGAFSEKIGNKAMFPYSRNKIGADGSNESISLDLMGTSQNPFNTNVNGLRNGHQHKGSIISTLNRNIFPGFASSIGGFMGIGSNGIGTDACGNNVPTTPLPFLSKNQVLNGGTYLLDDSSILPLPCTITKTLIKKRLLPSLNRMNGVIYPVNGESNSEVLVPTILHKRFSQFHRKYIDESAALCVNISQQIVSPLKIRIKDGHFTVDMFDQALNEVLEMLYQNTFSQIIKN